MEENKRITKGERVVPTQKFNGRTYYLYESEKYFSKGRNRMHREVWSYYNGSIPKGFHIHHVNGVATDNRIENLNIVSEKLHLRFEGKKRVKQNPEWFKDFHAKGIEAAKEWHSSDAGKEWHSKQSKLSWRNREYKKHICEECSKEYETRHSGITKYCHNNCKAKSNRRKRKLRK